MVQRQADNRDARSQEQAAGQAQAADERSRGERLKDYAYAKTPQKFKNASDLQVRFRTGFVYVTVSVLCILINDWTTLALLVCHGGIVRGRVLLHAARRCKASQRDARHHRCGAVSHKRVLFRPARRVAGKPGAAFGASCVVRVLAARPHSRCGRQLFRRGVLRYAAV